MFTVLLEYSNEVFVLDGELAYEGHKSSYIVNNLVPVTSYTFCVRAYTEGDFGHRSNIVSVTTPESGEEVMNEASFLQTLVFVSHLATGVDLV